MQYTRCYEAQMLSLVYFILHIVVNETVRRFIVTVSISAAIRSRCKGYIKLRLAKERSTDCKTLLFKFELYKAS